VVEGSRDSGVFIESPDREKNHFFNNIFNNTLNVVFALDNASYWNTTKQLGKRIFSEGTEIGGNYWANPSATGYSEMCTNIGYFCEMPYNISSGTGCTPGVDCGKNVDHLPLKNYNSNLGYEIISGCADIANPGIYRISKDFVADRDKCINISSDNVIVEGRGHMISSWAVHAGNAIYINSTSGWVKNVTLMNLKFENFFNTIYMEDGLNNTLDNLSITSNVIGIELIDSVSNEIKNSRIGESSPIGIQVHNNIAEQDLPNRIFNNLLNNTQNVIFIDETKNIWNVTRRPGIRVTGDSLMIGGNYWGKPTGTGFSDTCIDLDDDGFCEQAYNVSSDSGCDIGIDCGNNTDHLPYSQRPFFNYIDDCTSIDISGDYYLSKDILDEPQDICMNITANYVRLDCQFHAIEGNDIGHHGIYINRSSPQRSKVEITNCNVTDWNKTGIYIHNGRFNSINYTYVKSNGLGIHLNDTISNTIERILTSRNIIGIRMDEALNTSIEGIISAYNFHFGVGIYTGSSYTLINNSKILNNHRRDLEIRGKDTVCKASIENITGTDNKPVVFFNKTVRIENWNNNVSQIFLCNADNSIINNVTLNHVSGPTNGIFLTNVDNTTVTNNTINSSQMGLGMYNCENNTLTGNIFTNNPFGMFLAFSNGNKVFDNWLSMGGVGLHLEFSGYKKRNHVYNNFFNCTKNIDPHENVSINNLNTTRQPGARIYSDGTEIGGNFYANSDGTGFSERCANDGFFCTDPYDFLTKRTCTAEVDCGNTTDYLALSTGFFNPPSKNRFIIRNKTGEGVAVIDDKGDMYIIGKIIQGINPLTPQQNSFIIENKLGDAVSYINSTGDVVIKGQLFTNVDIASGLSRLAFWNRTDDIVGAFDSDGNLELRGDIAENYPEVIG
jgi:parallel beta-helix repeat protein